MSSLPISRSPGNALIQTGGSYSQEPALRTPWKYPGNNLVLGYAKDGRPVILPYQDRAQHVYMPGRTGSGKSRSLASCIRQDIASHPNTGCGIAVFDLHGELVDSIVRAMSCDVRFKDLPLVVIDFTDRDAVIKWNPLRRHPGVDPAVSARRMVEAIMHASGGLDITQTPTLQRTMTTVFHIAVERGLTFTDLLKFTDPVAHTFRAEIAREIEDIRTRTDLERMNGLTKARFEEEMLALHNRLSSLTSTAHMRAIFSVTSGGFSFAEALENGYIVLVNLATSGGTLAETDARVLSSLMLTELWQAAQGRGKGASGERRPFYVYVDEAPFIATPTIALQLAQARGFGLHFTIAAQATSQFEDFGGQYGHAIKKAVLRDTLTKIVMAQTAEEDDIKPLARELALAYYDPFLRKHTTTTYQVVSEEKEEYWTISKSASNGEATGTSETSGYASQRSRGRNWAHSTTSGGGSTTSFSNSTSDSVVTAEVLAAEIHPGSTSHVSGDAFTTGDHSTWGNGSSEGGSELEGATETTANGTTTQKTRAESEARQQHFRWRPVIQEVENPQFMSFDEQLHLWEQKLFRMYPRHALVSRQGMLAVEIATPTVLDPDYVDPAWVKDLLAAQRATRDFWVSLEEVKKLVAPTEDPIGKSTGLGSYGRRARKPNTATTSKDSGK